MLFEEHGALSISFKVVGGPVAQAVHVVDTVPGKWFTVVIRNRFIKAAKA